MTSSYLINLEADILQVSFDKDNPATGDRIVQGAQTRLEELIASGVLTGGSLLKINGRMSLPVSYTIAHTLGHLYSAIAVFDPRLQAYVVVISTNPEYQLGDLIDAENNLKSHVATEDSEYSFVINLKADNILKVGFNSKITANGDRIVKDTAAQLDKLIELGRLKGKLLKISGRASVLASYVIANKLAHCYGAIALFEPKEGDTGLDRYIVAISHNPHYQVGQTLDFESNYNCHKNAKVAICGFPGLGKTVLRDGLQKAIRQNLDRADDFLYVVSGCPDGDYPAWISDTAKNNFELSEKLRKDYKAQKFTSELAQAISQGIKAVKNPLLLFDVGGKISPENQQIMSGATHAIVLVQTGGILSRIKGWWQQFQWQQFCHKLGLKIIAIIYSDYRGKKDQIYTVSPIVKGSVHFLERGQNTSDRPTIQALAKQIIDLVIQ